jgi:hypothetical protein
MFGCLLDFQSGAIPFYVWLESRIISFHAGGPAREREREREREEPERMEWFRSIVSGGFSRAKWFQILGVYSLF